MNDCVFAAISILRSCHRDIHSPPAGVPTLHRLPGSRSGDSTVISKQRTERCCVQARPPLYTLGSVKAYQSCAIKPLSAVALGVMELERVP